MKIIKLLILFSVCFIACKKIDPQRVLTDVYVKDKTTSAVLPGAAVVVTSSKFSGAGAIISAHTADKDGKVHLDFMGEEGMAYYASAKTDKYFDNLGSPNILDKGKKESSSTIFLVPKGYVKLHVKNTQPFDEGDLIAFNSYCLSFNGTINSMTLDTSFYFGYDCEGSVFSNQNHDIPYWVTKNNIQTRYIQTIFVPAFDTVLVEINY